jgi:RimJ/RimL family protein N-acetyltransferase
MTAVAALDLPTLRTERLVLRPLEPADAPRIRELAGAREIAANTLTIPHPYEEGMAEAWIREAAAAATRGEKLVLAVTTEDDGLVGTVGLDLQPEHRRAELGYWIGKPFWGRGFATEAARIVIDHGFGALDLYRIYARVFPRNPGSGRVLEKLGMAHEGRLRGHILKWDVFEDVECYAVLATEWRSTSEGNDG